MASPLADIEFLARSKRRVDALRRFREGSADRDDLRTATDASKATIARLVNEFEDRNWVVRDGYEYELTDSGEFVAEEFLRLVDRIGTEHALRDIWQWFPTDLPGCTMSLFAGATIDVPEEYSPYHPLPHLVELVGSARSIRAFSKRSHKPGSYELFLRSAVAGREVEFLYPAAVVEDMLTAAPEELVREAVDSGRYTVLEHGSLPTDAGVALIDDRLGLYCRDDNGVTQAGVDTDAPEAVTWGESLYEELRAEARPVDLLGRLDGET